MYPSPKGTTNQMKPSAAQAKRGAAALLPFVERWNLSLNPEDVNEVVYAILTNYDRQGRGKKLFDAIDRDVNKQLDKYTRVNALGRPEEGPLVSGEEIEVFDWSPDQPDLCWQPATVESVDQYELNVRLRACPDLVTRIALPSDSWRRPNGTN